MLLQQRVGFEISMPASRKKSSRSSSGKDQVLVDSPVVAEQVTSISPRKSRSKSLKAAVKEEGQVRSLPAAQLKKTTKATPTKRKKPASKAAPTPRRSKKVGPAAEQVIVSSKPWQPPALQLPPPSEGPALIIVESPAKAKTIKKYLGAGYTVKASIGHIKDLPKNKLSVDIEHDFAPHYEVIRGKGKVVKEIKDAARNVKAIYLAPDPDREGEAIAWHIAQELHTKANIPMYRVRFHEITKTAIQAALQKPEALDGLRFASQQARRILDRIVGYQISPLLWEKVRRGLSAGRVQSVAVRLIVERERAIAAFLAEPYWTIQGTFGAALPPSFVAKVIKEDGKAFRPIDAEHAARALAVLQQASFHIAAVKERERRRRPAAPLITSKLQQEAANKLHFTAKRTMLVAQQLYEGIELGEEGAVGLITYMRTDSTRVSPEAAATAAAYIGQVFGAAYLPATPPVYKSKKAAQDAHEAIRPTSLDYTPERVAAFLTVEQQKLYQLIWSAFLASQMNPAVYEQNTVEIQAEQFLLRSTGSRLLFPGFLAAFPSTLQQSSSLDGANEGPAAPQSNAAEPSQEEDKGQVVAALPPLRQGEQLVCEAIASERHMTQPPPRFYESSLVRELEELGIGRPSTYATILSTIVSRGYVTKESNAFRPTELGKLITELLVASFPQVLDVAFTAHMESQLDEVETGKVDWVALLSQFYHGGFVQALATAQHEMRDVKKEEIPTGLRCQLCEHEMFQKWGRHGSFVACSNYPTCRNTRDFTRDDTGKLVLVAEQTTDAKCPLCQGAMVVKRGRFGTFFACQRYPECKGTKPVSIGVNCPNQCGGYIAERRSKRGRLFYGCSSYPNCNFVSWERPVASPCPLCQRPYLLRKVSKRDGIRFACSDKACGYRRDPTLEEGDAAALASGESG